MTLSAIDWAIVAAYFLLSAVIGLLFTKKGGEGLIEGGVLAWTNWIAGIVAVYSSLFGIGKLIFGETLMGIVLLAAAAAAFAWIARSFRGEGIDGSALSERSAFSRQQALDQAAAIPRPSPR